MILIVLCIFQFQNQDLRLVTVSKRELETVTKRLLE